MFRKGMLKSGCLIKCTKDVEIDKYHKVFVKGRPYRVIITNKILVLKGENGAQRALISDKKGTIPWTAFSPFKR